MRRATSAAITGLANGTPHTVRVAAVNAAGAGAWSTEATKTPAGVPDAPREVTAASGDRALDVSWEPPPNNGSEIKRYVVQWKAGGDFSTARQRTTTSTSATVPGLVNGTTYTVRVAAVNGIGAGPWSTEATKTAATVPSAPRNLTVERRNSALAATWTAPASTGGLAIEEYRIQWTTDPSDYGPDKEGTVTGTTATLPFLVNGTEYMVRVAAVNGIGAGAWSTQESGTPSPPPTVPGRPEIDAVDAADRRLVVRWSPPANDGGDDITGYIVRWRTQLGSYNAANTHPGIGASVSSDTIDELDKNTRYWVQVAAVNGIGAGRCSDAVSATIPMTAPGAPLGLAVAGGDAELQLSWRQPHDTGGAQPLTYVVQWRSGDQQYDTTRQQTTVSTSATITGLDNGTRYWVKVTATNAEGSTPGVERDGTPLTGPGPPTMVEFTSDPMAPGRLVLSWAAPDDNGGTALTGYMVRWRVHGERDHEEDRVGAASLSHRIDGLVSGTRYWAQVRAFNRVGNGPWSDLLSTVPLAVPGAPRAVAAEARDAGLGVTWQAPASDGGDPITEYKIQWRTTSGAFGAAVAVDAATHLHEITALTNNTRYVVQVVAVNSQGDGSAAQIHATPLPPTVPGPPIIAAVVPRDEGLRVTWTPPLSDGRTPITEYKIQWRTTSGAFGAAVAVDAATHLHEITALTNNTRYVVQVVAVNSQGDGSAAQIHATPLPPTVPGPPIIAAVVPREGGVTVQWLPPPDDGRAPVSSYRLSWPGGHAEITDPTDLSHDIVGLDFALDSVIRISAVNSQGEGTPAAVRARSNQVPGPPQRVLIAEDDGSLVVRWKPPGVVSAFVASYSGFVVTEYLVQWKTSGQEYSTDRQATVTPDSIPDNSYGVYTITGLNNGSDYSVRVIAVNEGRRGPPGEVSGRPRPAVEGAPPRVVAYNYGERTGELWVDWWPAIREHDGVQASIYELRWGPAGQASSPSGYPRIPGGPRVIDVGSDAVGTVLRVRVRAVYGGTFGPWAETLVAVAAPPTIPQRLTATPGDGSASLQWDPPESDRGSPISAYVVIVNEVDDIEDQASVVVTGESYEMTGLENGRTYTLHVAALNNVGIGYRNEVMVTPNGEIDGPSVPGAPEDVVVVPGDGSLAVSWAAPADHGGAAASAYQVSWEAAGQPGTAQQADVGAALSHVITGLVNGTDYAVEVTAANSAGTGQAAAVTAAPAAAGAQPGAPGGIVVVPGDGMLLVSWHAATDSTGAAASRYEVSWEAAGQPGTAQQADVGAALSHVITGLVNGTDYVVEVTAANSAGKGPAIVTRAVPTGVPSAPRGVVAARSTVVAGTARILLNWLPPDDNGGTKITAYRVSWRADGESYDDSQCSHRRADTTATGHPIGDLDADTTYHVRVAAINAAGPGPATEITIPPGNTAAADRRHTEWASPDTRNR